MSAHAAGHLRRSYPLPNVCAVEFYDARIRRSRRRVLSEHSHSWNRGHAFSHPFSCNLHQAGSGVQAQVHVLSVVHTRQRGEAQKQPTIVRLEHGRQIGGSPAPPYSPSPMAEPWLRVSLASLAPRLPSVEGTSFPLQASNHSSTDAAIRDALLRNGRLEDAPSRLTTPAAWLDDRITLHRLHWSLICQERGRIIAEPSTKVAKYPVLFFCMCIRVRV